MKNNRKMIIALLMILVLSMTVPAFADGESAAEDPGSAAAEPAEQENAESEGSAEAQAQEDANTENVAAFDGSPETSEDTSKGSTSEENAAGRTIVLSAGEGGRLSLAEDGTVICAPESGYEVVSITADRDAGSVKAGGQIPETELGSVIFRDGTAVTAVFERIETDREAPGAPASASAVFG